jgi:hypothetical protein
VAYGRFEVKNVARWRTFLDLLYGLELRPSDIPGELEAVVDDAGSRLIFTEGPADDLVANGWLCDDLDGLKGRIEAFGARAEWGSEEEARARGAGRLLRTIDPNGLVVECLDATASHNAFMAPNHGQTFRTGALGVGHFTF